MARRATDQTEAERRAVADEINQAADQLADLWDADRRSTTIHLPDLRGYLTGLTGDSVSASTRPLEAMTLPRTREFPPWTPRPPQRQPAIEAENVLGPARPGQQDEPAEHAQHREVGESY